LATFFTPQIPRMIKLYKTINGAVAEKAGACHLIDSPCWDSLINRESLYAHIAGLLEATAPSEEAAIAVESPIAPIGSQEVWAAGVTYFSSRLARMEESKDAGGGDFYSRVYEADRPELFYKSSPGRVKGPGEKVRIRKDSEWDVPEPEATLFINSSGSIQGYTIGNDMSSRSIEGENPLYLPQAKSYDGSAALGPCLLLTEEAPSPETGISLEILRGGKTAFSGESSLAMMKRNFVELVEFLYRETSFPNGAFLMTGTGIVPGNDFTLRSGDEINITIDGIGTLTNPVE
jgi:2-dehydro-3-deoxy-D-arabinonate dehydratase